MSKINWLQLQSRSQIEEIIEHSKSVPCLIFKHSTRCSISSLAQNRLSKGWSLADNDVLPYHLDLIAHRDLSNAVAEQFGVRHESPQVLLIKDGRCVYDASHLGISATDIASQVGA
ncbi:bacillithiol system redox-active protein YtxJ [Phaeodactylibacter xiamenensis]|jgi:bacillithiol system protein YtxJ|uniref:bacillithiol system redox-active protein YtxJ n=1 Tax=Phaeodactylibacter xiamenensis TaxID=1524460 RepID=UPI001930E565|nr:bacillithiol system redox-active protein YtxJ [Phaeodactylibacter xiamenensis]